MNVYLEHSEEIMLLHLKGANTMISFIKLNNNFATYCNKLDLGQFAYENCNFCRVFKHVCCINEDRKTSDAG